MLIKNRKGFLKIAEAATAILIIMGALLIGLRSNNSQNQQDLSEMARDILSELAKDNNLRNLILTNSNVPYQVASFVDARMPNYLSYEIVSCEVNEACGQTSYITGDVYSAERIISSDLDIPLPSSPNFIKPKKLRLFIWIEEK